MPVFRELEQTFRDMVEAAAGKANAAGDAAMPSEQPGFGEDQSDFAAPGSRHAIEKAEKACLDHQACGVEELYAKTGFILERMRDLTDSPEEFDDYAQRLLADLNSAVARNA
ncbi:MAG: hypothetical protein KJ622_14375 [Alphaproteobacteria bacterium]|nr:hypothetical protein [Alphaproteobacteria bacterium]